MFKLPRAEFGILFRRTFRRPESLPARAGGPGGLGRAHFEGRGAVRAEVKDEGDLVLHRREVDAADAREASAVLPVSEWCES